MKEILFTGNKDEETKMCVNCIYYEEKDDGGYCIKKKKTTEPMAKCRKFELDIMSKSAKRRHSPVKKAYNSSDFDI